MTSYVKCECGMVIKGINEAHAKAILKIHKTSKKHKEQMQIKKEMVIKK